MGIFDDSFSMELKHPIDKETWKIIEDAELDNTEHIYFTTPSGKRVNFIKADVLDKIREDIADTLYVDSLIFGELIDFKNGKISADDVIEKFNRVARLEVLKIFDKHKESEEV